MASNLTFVVLQFPHPLFNLRGEQTGETRGWLPLPGNETYIAEAIVRGVVEVGRTSDPDELEVMLSGGILA